MINSCKIEMLKYRVVKGILNSKYKVKKYKDRSFMGRLSYKFQLSFKKGNSYNFYYLSEIKESKITPIVWPGTGQHTDPLITIGGGPTETMGPRLQVLGLVGGVPGFRNWVLIDSKSFISIQSYKLRRGEISYKCIFFLGGRCLGVDHIQ